MFLAAYVSDTLRLTFRFYCIPSALTRSVVCQDHSFLKNSDAVEFTYLIRQVVRMQGMMCRNCDLIFVN